MDNQIEKNEFAPAEGQRDMDVMASTATNKEMEVVKAQIFMAKQFPRDQFAAMNRIIDAVKRPSLAQAATYQYARGGTNITGPSIRLAEVAAQNWGNIDYGVRELERHEGESVAQAYAWDLETNVRVEKTFTVRHVLDTKRGPKELKSDRDIYEMVANNGARRLRAAIMEVIPGDVFEKAVAQAGKTLEGQSDQPLSDRIAHILQGFDENLGVTREMIEKRVQRKAETINEHQYGELVRIAQSLMDGIGSVEDFFEVEHKDDAADQLAKKLKDKAKKEADKHDSSKSEQGSLLDQANK